MGYYIVKPYSFHYSTTFTSFTSFAMATPTSTGPCSLFVGNLDPRVYRELLLEIFNLAGFVSQCHVVFDKTTGISSGFGFVDYDDHDTAQTAMEKFRGTTIYGKLLTIDWARAAGRDGNARAEEAAAYCLFVGNLSPDVSDDQLLNAFSQFGSCVSAKCAKDPVTNKTQGFAFVSFQQRPHAAAAMDEMNGQVLNNRPLRVEWAKGKTNAATRAAALGLPEPALGAPSPMPPQGAHHINPMPESDKSSLTFQSILAQTTPNNITAYVAGLGVNTTEQQIRQHFASYGEIREIRIPDSIKAQATETMYAFVRYIEHDAAARAIHNCQGGVEVNGRIVQVHWGRESVRRGPTPAMGRPPPHMMGAYHGGFQAQPNYQGHYPPQGYANRPPYAAQPYPRTGPAPMYQQPHDGGQNRYRS